MAVTNQELFNIFLENPNMSDSQIVTLMETEGISPEQVSSTFNIPVGEIAARVADVIPPNQAVLLGDTYVQAVNQVIGSGMDQQIGGVNNVITYKASENQAGGGYQQYTPTGELQRTGVQQEVNAGQDFLKFLAGSAGLFGGLGGGFESLFGGGGAANLTAEQIAALTAQDLAIGGGALAGYAPLTAAQIAALTAQDLAIGGGALAGTPLATIPGLLTPTVITPPVVTPPVVPPTVVPPVVPPGVPPVVPPIIPPVIPPVGDLLKAGLTTAQIAQLLSTGATTAAGLLQQQTSREAAQRAQQMIDTETAAAKQAAQFRPVGMTTRFGTSQFQVDPVTGQLTSAGYTLSPEAKAAQDRFVKLAEQGIQQAEGAQKAFEPLQTGAQSLFTLGQGYLAKTPEAVAENYLKSQMALLQPGRELELANLQNRLQQQGRGGLAVAQGGTLGATTPELQALYNARAQQEAQLAANAQQYGQQNVAFGAGLLGTGAQTMGNYYAGQQAAYQPYTTALGQVQGLETAAQQPLTMGTALGQQAAQAGANVGRLGLSGAEFSTRLATGADATTNPYSTLLSGIGASNTFGQAIGGLFGGTPQASFTTGLTPTSVQAVKPKYPDEYFNRYD